jgi:hypothetical protein
VETIHFSLLQPQTGSGPDPASYSISTATLSLGLKRPWREVDHHLHLMHRSRMSATNRHSLTAPSWRARDNFTFITSWSVGRLVGHIEKTRNYGVMVTTMWWGVWGFTTVETCTVVFCVAITPCSPAVGYQSCREMYQPSVEEYKWSVRPSEFRSHYGPGVDSDRNEYQEYFLGGKGSRCVGLTTLPPSCADCLEIWEPQSPGALRACPGM